MPSHFFAWSIIRFSVLFNLRLFNKHAHICLRCCLIRSISRQIQFGRHFASFYNPFCACCLSLLFHLHNLCMCYVLPSFIWTVFLYRAFWVRVHSKSKVARSTKSTCSMGAYVCRFSHARTFGSNQMTYVWPLVTYCSSYAIVRVCCFFTNKKKYTHTRK